MEYIKKNFSLIVGITIPILMIVFVAASIYIPPLFIKPKFNFVYLSGDDAYYQNHTKYTVVNGRLIKTEVTDDDNNNFRKNISDTRIFIHNVLTNTNKEVTIDELNDVHIDTNKMSPDGFEVEYGSNSNGIFPFFIYDSTDYNTQYIKGHNTSRKLNLNLNNKYYYSNFYFIGWIN